MLGGRKGSNGVGGAAGVTDVCGGGAGHFSEDAGLHSARPLSGECLHPSGCWPVSLGLGSSHGEGQAKV